MDILIEFILELLFEGLFAGASSKRVPGPLRVIFIIILLLIYAAFIGIFVLIGSALISKGNIGGGVAIIACGLAVAVLLLWMVFRERRKKLERMHAEQSSNIQGRY
ncbi:MAG: hypothetical protein IJM32_10725 [Ruminococcus sp.]|nr:hypothetical protein [Ruminococcus sp.]